MEKPVKKGVTAEKYVRLQLENIVMQAINQTLIQENRIDEATYCVVNQKIAERRQPCVNTY